MPQSTPLRDDARDGFTIDPFFINRVEVIFGSNAIQGVGGAGGVINYVTAAPRAEGAGPSGRVQATTTFDDSVFGDSVGGPRPASPGKPATIRLKQPGERRPNGRTSVLIDPADSTAVRAVDAET